MTAVDHEEFAKRAERRLRAAADRLEDEAQGLGIGGGAARTAARAGELRIAALLVRGEAEAVSAGEASPTRTHEDPAGPPPLEAQG